jgi:hypothetical protein
MGFLYGQLLKGAVGLLGFEVYGVRVWEVGVGPIGGKTAH